MWDVEDLITHMRPVLAAERDLRELAVVWQMIESSTAIGCAGEAEATLGTLIEQMVIENLAEVDNDLRRVLWNGSALIESRGTEAPRLKAVLRQAMHPE